MDGISENPRFDDARLYSSFRSAHMSGTALAPVESPVVPHGFQAYQMPSHRADRPVVWRNWKRPSRPRRRQHVVVLEPDPRILEIVGELLDDEGYDVTLSWQALTASEMTGLRPDVVFVEASFNQDGGLDLFPEPLTSRMGTSIPVIYSTLRPKVASMLSDGDVAVLLKPFDLDELLEMLSHVCH